MESMIQKGQENKSYIIEKDRETFYRPNTVPITRCSAVKDHPLGANIASKSLMKP